MEAKPEDQALIESLINTPAQPAMAAAAAGTTSVQAQPRTTTKPRSKPNLYDQIVEGMAYMAALTIGLGLWAAGAFFTLIFLEGAGVPVAPAQVLAWLIPAFISAVELKLWPARGRSPIRGLIWLAVLAFDVGTSFAGLVEWAGGRHFNIFTGITVPTTGTILWVFALIFGLLFAFAPERIGKFAIRELRTLLKI